MAIALSGSAFVGGLPLESLQDRELPAGNLEAGSPATIQEVSKPSAVQTSTEHTQTAEGQADKQDDRAFDCDRWLISVSSAVPEGKMISADNDMGEMADLKNEFVVYVSEPNRERTLVRTAEDFYRLQSDLVEPKALLYNLPLGVGPRDDSIKTSGEVAPKDSQPTSPSQKPKKRGSSFFAKVRSVFKDLDQAKTPPVQNKDSERLHVSTTDPPISPPHSPTARSHVELGLFEFEKGKPLTPYHSRSFGTKANGFLSLTPSNSSADNAKGDNVKQITSLATEAITDRVRSSSSSSTLGESVQASPRLSDQRKLEPSSDAALQPLLSSSCPANALNVRSLKLSSSSGDSDREGVHIALANYLSGLCKDSALSTSTALRSFFATRSSDLEHQSNKNHNLVCRNIGIIASEKEQDVTLPPPAFAADTNLAENSLPRRIRSAENGIGGSDLLENTITSNRSHIRLDDDRQASADVHVSHLESERGIITRTTSCSQQAGGINGLGTPAQPPTVPNASTKKPLRDVNNADISAKSIQKDDANGLVDVPPKSTARRPLTVDDFDLIRTLGKGCAGKVVLVRHKQSQKVYAMKAMVKKHVIAHSELQHTLIEQAVLKRMSTEKDEQLRNPFIVKLWWSFHDEYNLYLVLDFHPGGDLATQLSRWGRLGRDRARFYTAEIVEGVEGLHAAGVIYRDLKPENVLLGQDGHIVLVDFGLAADFFPHHRSPGSILPHWMATGADQAAEDGRPMMHRHATDVLRAKERDLARSFVGTAEYLAPEVIRGLPYSYEVDWWSLGTMLYEALIGNTPFWAENHAEMYVGILNNELLFPEDNVLDRDTRSFIRGLLCKDPAMRLTEPRIKRHPYLSMVDFDHVRSRRYIPPYIPPTDSSLEFDTSNFDKAFLVMDTNLKRETVNIENVNHEDKHGPPAVDDTAFTVYNFGESEMVHAISGGSDIEKTEICSRTDEDDVLSNKCQTKSDDEGDLASSSDSVSISISDFGSEHGLGTAASKHPMADYDDNDSTIGSIDNQKQETSMGRISEEMSPAVLERIKTLASEPGVKASARHSRDLSRVSVDLEHRHHLDIGDRRSADEWTILEAEPEQQATNGRKVSDTLFAKGVVDKYRLALRKRRGATKLSRQPSWRSPSSSLIMGRAGNGNNLRDTEKATGGFLTPLSPTLAGIKSKFKNRSRSKQRFTVEPTSPKAGPLMGRNLRPAPNEGTTHGTGGMLSAPYPTDLGPMPREGSVGEFTGPSDDARNVELDRCSETNMLKKADATYL